MSDESGERLHHVCGGCGTVCTADVHEVIDGLERDLRRSRRENSRLRADLADKHRKDPRVGQIAEVLEFWKERWGKARTKIPLDGERAAKVRAQLKIGRTVPELKLAIEGVAYSPHHMGENEGGKVYVDLVTILRSERTTEAHIRRALENGHVLPSDAARGPENASQRPVFNEKHQGQWSAAA